MSNEEKRQSNLWKKAAQFLDWVAKIIFSGAAAYFAYAQLQNSERQQVVAERQSISTLVEKIIENSKINRSNSIAIEALTTYGESSTPFLVAILKDTTDTNSKAEIAHALNKVGSEGALINIFNDREIPDSTKDLMRNGLRVKMEDSELNHLKKRFEEDHYWMVYVIVSEAMQNLCSNSSKSILEQLKENDRLPIRAKIEMTEVLKSKSAISDSRQDSILVDYLEEYEDSTIVASVIKSINMDSELFKETISSNNLVSSDRRESMFEVYSQIHPEYLEELDLDQVTFIQSPNGKKLGQAQTLTFIAVRSTGGINLAGDIKWYTDWESKQGVHFLIARNGEITKLGDPEFFAAWHLRGYNSNSIGIGLTNWGELKYRNEEYYAWPNNFSKKVDIQSAINCKDKYYEAYTTEQYVSLNKLINSLCSRYNIPAKYTRSRDSLVSRNELGGVYGVDYFYKSRDDLRGNPGCIIDWDRLDISDQN